jgi:hypothetical protein
MGAALPCHVRSSQLAVDGGFENEKLAAAFLSSS